jgi:pyruvate,water dikinase
MLAGLSGEPLLDAIETDIAELKRMLFDPRSHQVFMGAMDATWWLNDHLLAWLGEKNVADTLTLSVANNVTSEMGLALLDLADVIRPHPAVVAFLETVGHDTFVDELALLDGGGSGGSGGGVDSEVHAAFVAFLDRYGRRGPGEIDITRPRWREHPLALVPLILGHVRNFAPGEAARRFEHGRRQAAAKEREVLDRLRALPDGGRRADETKAMIDRVRTFIGYREHPKYVMIGRYLVYKQALLGEAVRLVAAGVLQQPDDVFWFSFAELRDIVATRHVDRSIIARRQEAFRSHQALTPPRVLTSDGEDVAGQYRRDGLPAGALAGLAVSAGVVEGRARVVADAHDAALEPGDILVTAFTDPSWTPLFVTIAGLVTEVGGLMTHGAVIAREYGLPAVVGVPHATALIRDGQRIRVQGTDGYVELLS